MGELKYIGPDYVTGLWHNGALIDPRSWTADHARKMIASHPPFARLFAGKETTVVEAPAASSRNKKKEVSEIEDTDE